MMTMINESTLHILNGQAMYDFFKRTNFLHGEMMVPFNEAMCFGDTSDESYFTKIVNGSVFCNQAETFFIVQRLP
jgi:hypothetical protein